MPFNISEFFEFVKYFLPQAYIIAAGIILIIWLISQANITEQTKKHAINFFGVLFLAGFLLSFSLASLNSAAIFMPEFDINLRVLISKWYLISLVDFYITAMFIVLLTPKTKLSTIAILLFVILVPVVFVLHFYDFFQLSQIALSQ